MMSNKWAFSLTTLITIFALGLIASPAFALEVTPKLADDKNLDDVSIADGYQVLVTTRTVRFVFNEPVQELDEAALLANFQVVGDSGANLDSTDASPAAAALNAANTVVTLTLGGTILPDKSATIYMLAEKFISLKDGGKNPIASITLNYVKPEPHGDNFTTATDITSEVTATGADEMPADPKVVSIVRAVPISLPRASSFVEKTVTGPFQVKILLSEKPNGGLHSDTNAARIDALNVSGGSATNVAIGVEFVREGAATSPLDAPPTNPPPAEGDYSTADDDYPTRGTQPGNKDPVPVPTGRDGKYYPYLVTIEPDGSADKVIISVKDFKDQVRARGEGTGAIKAGMYEYPGDKAATPGREKLEVPVVKNPAGPKEAGLSISIPNGIIIPASGYLVVAKDDGDGDDNHEKRTDSTAVVYPGDPKDADIMANERTPEKRTYNVIKAGLPNLETFLGNGGTIVLMGPSGLVISEIMWGSDASLTESFESQWIEIMNPGTQVATDGVKLVFYGPGASDQAAVAALDATKVADTVGTVGAGGYWSIAGKGQSGRTGVGEAPGDIVAVTPTQSLISMQRVIDATGMAADGTMASGWAASIPPALNFNTNVEGTRIGTPGASPAMYPVAPTPEPEPTPAAVVPVAMADDIMITEIMVDTGDGRLPQWIELTNVSMKEVSLAGWSVEIENSADAIGPELSINLSGTLGVSEHMGNKDKGKSLLLVAWTHRSSSNLQDNDRIVDVRSAVNGKGRYKLISDEAFMIQLLPPQTTGIVQYGDAAGNLGATEAWDLPMSENGRSSLIRYEMTKAGMATMGTDADGWKLASSTGLVSGPPTWYGSDEDSGTPGYDAGGPLPVELSHFRPARDKATGAVVITWATQSELNNAGFFIKRSNQRDGEFKVINAAMVPGAGTTSEKQFYTYTDTTAQPNVVYYYQIEDVSLDGNRQTLTRGIRLKGHVGAAGKATVIWGELKTSHE